MSAISTYSFGVWIASETKHGSLLEFVLSASLSAESTSTASTT